jgi:ethanolaminephosphotransferase
MLNIAEADTEQDISFGTTHDNLLSQFIRVHNARIKFFGDDTWLRLFPGMFAKEEGVSSLFATVRLYPLTHRICQMETTVFFVRIQ